MNRNQFLKTTTLGSIGILLSVPAISKSQMSFQYGVHHQLMQDVLTKFKEYYTDMSIWCIPMEQHYKFMVYSEQHKAYRLTDVEWEYTDIDRLTDICKMYTESIVVEIRTIYLYQKLQEWIRNV